jgi:peptidoglycan/xylan/chitin deacetylase (PgdA/CDA1 family)
VCADANAMDECDPCALMTPEELAMLAAVKGVEIGGHTARHPILSRASSAEQRREIEQNLGAIQQWTGRSVRAFAYPNGRPGVDYTAETMTILRDTGVDMAFTTRESFARAAEPALEHSRFILHDETGDAELAHRLTYSWPR